MEALLVVLGLAAIVGGAVLIFKAMKKNGTVDEVVEAAKDAKDKVVDLIKKD